MAYVSAFPTPGAQRPAWRLPSVHLLGGLLMVLGVAVLTLVPVLVVVVGSFDVAGTGEPARYGLDAWRQALLESPRTRSALLNSFLLALRGPAGAAIGFALAWLVIRTRLPARGLIESALWTAYFLPALPVTVGWILLLDPHYGLLNQLAATLPFVSGPLFNVYSIPGILWIHMTVSTVPVMVILLGPAIRQLDASLEEAGRVCGGRPWHVFRRITLPLLMPAILTGGLIGFIRGLEAFEVEQVVGRPADIYVYSTRIFDLVSLTPPQFPEAMALSTFVLAILAVIAVLYQRLAQGRHHATLGGRGMSYQPLRLGRGRYMISTLLLAFLAFVVVVPIVMLLVGSAMTLFGFFDLAQPFTTRHWERVLSDPAFRTSMRNSLAMSLGTATLGVLIYAALAYALLRSRLWGRGAVDLLVWLPWTVPGILLGIGLLFMVLSVPGLGLLYGSMLALILVLVVKELPMGTHMMKSSLGQVAVEMEQSSRVCGAGWLTTWRRILLPLMRPILVSLFVVIFCAAQRDISTIALLATPATRPLSILMLEYSQAGALEAAAVLGTISMLLMALVALLVRWLGLSMRSGV